MSDPGPDPDPAIERLRTELQHAPAEAPGEVATVLENLTLALGNLDADADDTQTGRPRVHPGRTGPPRG
jgi:hypothetical protein